MFLPRSHAVCVCRVHQPSPNWYSSNSAFHVVTSSGRERWRTFHWVSPIPLAFTWRLMPPSGLSQQRTFLIEKSTPVAAQSWHQVRKQHGSPPALWFRLCIQGALGLRQKGLKCIIAFIAQDPPLLICVQNEKISSFSITPFWFSSWGMSTVFAVGHGSAVTNMSVYTIVY